MQSSTYSIPCQSFVSVADKSLFGRRQGRLLPAGLLRINLSSLPSSDPLIGAFAMRKALYFSCAISLAISFPVRIVHAEDWAARCNALAGSPIEPGNADRGIAFEKIDPQPALAACQNALRSDPDSAAILFRIGRAYHKNNEPLQAFRYYEAAAKKRYVAAQNNIGSLYQSGAGIPRDIGKAAEWYSVAAASELSLAQRNLGMLHYFGDGVPQNYAKAAKYFSKAADQEDAVSEFYLGQMYSSGKGVDQNYRESVKWYEKSANHGNNDALAYLAAAYYYGSGAQKDINKAVQLFDLAIERRSPHAHFMAGQMFSRGIIVKKNASEAMKYFRLAEGSGDPLIVEHAKKELASLEGVSAGTTQGLTGGQIVGGLLVLGLGAALLAGSDKSESETSATEPARRPADDPYAEDPCSQMLITPQSLDEWAVASAFGCPPKF